VPCLGAARPWQAPALAVIAPEWEPAVDAAMAAPLAMLVGESDAGKTTLVTALANALLARGHAVGIVDADLGQSEIGPPTTVGLGRVTAPIGRPSEAELVALHFVGATSPAAGLAASLVAARRMVDRARAEGFARILVDTSGLVAGELGRTLKQAKIDLLEPDLVVALQRGRECEPILGAYAGAARPLVLRLPALGTPRGRSQEDRRRYRARALRAYFAGAREATLDLGRVVLRTPPLFAGVPLSAGELAAAGETVGRRLVWGERRDRDVLLVSVDRLSESEARALTGWFDTGAVVHWALADLVGALAGLDSRDRQTLGLAVVRGMDPAGRQLRVLTPVPPEAIASATICRERFPD
jgi:polynucleotide 5'-hydroxyl-kinase GRC3/NOL9